MNWTINEGSEDMGKQRRNRHSISLDRKRHLADLAESKPAPGAVKAFSRKAYECCDVLGYMVKKYDIKGGDRDWRGKYPSR